MGSTKTSTGMPARLGGLAFGGPDLPVNRDED